MQLRRKPIAAAITGGITDGLTGPIVGAAASASNDPLWTQDFSTAQLIPGATHTRASTQMVETDTGALFEVPVDAIPIKGARPGRNLAPRSLEFSVAEGWTRGGSGTYTNGQADPDGGTNATLVECAANDTGPWRQVSAYVSGVHACNSIWIKGAAGTTTVQVHNGSSYVNVTVDTTWRRYSKSSLLSGNGYVAVRAAAGTAFSIYQAQAQDITHRSALSTAPDEFIDPDTDYGTGVNGFRYFTTALANTVEANGVVTEATGSALSDIALAMVPGATNLFMYSSDVSNSYWAKVNANTPSAKVLREASDTNQVHYFSKGFGVSAGVRYVFWVLVSNNDRDFVRLDCGSSGFPADCECYFDTTNGVVGETVGSDLDDYGIFEYGNGFVCFISVTATSNNAGVFFVSMAIDDGDQDYDGDGASELTIEHLQVETNAFTSPIPTSGSTASTDAAVLDFSGVDGFSATNETRIIATGLNASLDPDPTDTTDRNVDADDWDGTDLSDLVPHGNIISVTQYAPGERP